MDNRETIVDRMTDDLETLQTTCRGLQLLLKGINRKYAPDVKMGALMLREVCKTKAKKE